MSRNKNKHRNRFRNHRKSEGDPGAGPLVLDKSGNRVTERVTIAASHPDLKSRAAYILLVERLTVADEERMPVERRGRKNMKDWLLFREMWLKWILTEEGTLKCAGCGREGLEIGGRTWPELKHNESNPNLATIDHVYPVSKGGPRYELGNLQVMCKKCNGKKADKVPEGMVAPVGVEAELATCE